MGRKGRQVGDIDPTDLAVPTLHELHLQIKKLQTSIDLLCSNHAMEKRDQLKFREEIQQEIKSIRDQTSIKESLAELADSLRIEFSSLRNELSELKQRQIEDTRRVDNALQDFRSKQQNLVLRLDDVENTHLNTDRLEKTLQCTTDELKRETQVHGIVIDKMQRNIDQLSKQVPQLEQVAIPEIIEKLNVMEQNLATANEVVEQALNTSHLSAGVPREAPSNTNDELNSLHEYIAKLEDQLRRNNVIIHGIPLTTRQESWEETERLVQCFLQQELNVTGVSIERAHRLYTTHSNTIIVRFQHYKDRETVLQSRHKLMGTSFRIKPDFSYLTKCKRSLLWDYAQENKVGEEKFSIRYDKLKLRGQTFDCNVFTGQVQLTKPLHRPTGDPGEHGDTEAVGAERRHHGLGCSLGDYLKQGVRPKRKRWDQAEQLLHPVHSIPLRGVRNSSASVATQHSSLDTDTCSREGIRSPNGSTKSPKNFTILPLMN